MTTNRSVEKTLTTAPACMRADAARGVRGGVDRDGGLYGAGMVEGVSVITLGEASGHDLWIDGTFLSQTVELINSSAAASGGIKARFTHPGLSGDGLGTYLGRVATAWSDGDRVLADLHFVPSSHATPDGDLAEYVSQLADDDPEAFGMSVVFDHDLSAEDAHRSDNTQGGHFVSPDEDNANNWQHARIDRLRAVDVVDEPAANPAGLFSDRQEIAADADALAAYALRLTDERPQLARFSVNPDRVAGFVQRFLTRHGLKITGGDIMTAKKANTDTAGSNAQESTAQPEALATKDAAQHAAELRDAFSTDLSRYTDAFGAERGCRWFGAQVDFSTAQTVHDELQQTITALRARVDELAETLSSIDRGDDQAAGFASDDIPNDRKRSGLNKRIRITGKTYDDN